MLNLFNKTRRSFFLSNIFRNIFYFINIFFAFALPLKAQWLDAYIADFKVNDDNINSYQTNSQMGVDTAGNFTIVWYDARNFPEQQYPSNIYCQRYNKDGLALGNNFIIGQDSVSAPKITVLNNGNFIVLWFNLYIENVYDYYQYYFQRFDKNGVALSPPSKVMDTAYIYSSVLPSGYCISSDSLGRFIVCWSKGNRFDDSPNVYFQRFDSSGIMLGGIDSVMDGNSIAEFPDVAMNKDGSFVIAWKDNRFAAFGKNDIYMQRYNPSGIKVGVNTKVNDDIDTNIEQVGARVSTNGNGSTVVAWIDSRNNQTGIFYQMYDSLGNRIGINKKADILTTFGLAGSPKISMRADKFFYIGWLDFRYAGKDQYWGRRFNNLGNPISNPYMIPMSSPGSSEQTPNGIHVSGDRVYATWTDDRNGGLNNYDIYCNVRGFQNPDTVIGIANITETAKEYRLYPAYPNPFNPETKIKYDLPKDDDVIISIYDITGKTIKQFNTRKQNKGTYEITITNELLSSGVYFLKFQTASGFNAVQKLVLLK